MLEPHLDALGILHQSGTDLVRQHDPWGLAQITAGTDSSWGVFAAEVGRRATRGGQHGGRVGAAGHQAVVLARRRCLARSGDGFRRRVASAAVRGGHARAGRAAPSERVVRARPAARGQQSGRLRRRAGRAGRGSRVVPVASGVRVGRDVGRRVLVGGGARSRGRPRRAGAIGSRGPARPGSSGSCGCRTLGRARHARRSRGSGRRGRTAAAG